MGRVVNVNNPTTVRNQHMRTAAELLHQLSQKDDVDADARDMAAQVVLSLRAIEEGIDSSADAWEKRDYWVKAEQLRRRWMWAGQYAGRLEAVICQDQWQRLPDVLVELFPKFADIKIARLTRESDAWSGAYERLLAEQR